MEPLQPTVRQGVAQLKDFITKLVDIEEKEGKDFPTVLLPKAFVQVYYLTPPTALPTETKPVLSARSNFC